MDVSARSRVRRAAAGGDGSGRTRSSVRQGGQRGGGGGNGREARLRHRLLELLEHLGLGVLGAGSAAVAVPNPREYEVLADHER